MQSPQVHGEDTDLLVLMLHHFPNVNAMYFTTSKGSYDIGEVRGSPVRKTEKAAAIHSPTASLAVTLSPLSLIIAKLHCLTGVLINAKLIMVNGKFNRSLICVIISGAQILIGKLCIEREDASTP